VTRHGRRQQWWLYNRRITGPALLFLTAAFAWALIVVSMAAVLLVAELTYPP
jgi:hypothetical protein